MSSERKFGLIQGGQEGPADLTSAAKRGDIQSKIHNQDNLTPDGKRALLGDMRSEQIQQIRIAVDAATGTLVDVPTAEDIHAAGTQLVLTEDIPTRRRLLEELKQRHPNLTAYFSRFESVVRNNKLEE